MYKLIISNRAKKKLKKISRLHQEAIITALAEIKSDPLLGKPLTRELTGRFSYRVGVFRVIYKINKQDMTIHVLTAGYRSVVYS